MKIIHLSQGMVAIVDDDDYDMLSAYNWYFSPVKGERTGYAVTAIDRKTTYMHRLVVNASSGQEVDHKNRYGLDNQKSNLRIATRSQNMSNTAYQHNHTGYRGVFFDKDTKKYRCKVGDTRCGTAKIGPRRNTAIEAAFDYDAIALAAYGEFAQLNFLPNGESLSPQQEAR